MREYNGPTRVEPRFHFLKVPTFVDAVFLKKPARIEALGYVRRPALLLFSALERPVPGTRHPGRPPSRGNLARPTRYDILRCGRGIQVLRQDETHRYAALPHPYDRALQVILAALDVT